MIPQIMKKAKKRQQGRGNNLSLYQAIVVNLKNDFAKMRMGQLLKKIVESCLLRKSTRNLLKSTNLTVFLATLLPI